MLWGGGGPAVVGGCNPGRSGPVGNLKLLVRHPSRENKSVQGLDRVPGVSWSLCATVSRGLEALGGCARHGKRTRSAGDTKLKRVDGNRVVKSGWGKVGFCSSVRSTPFTVPNPQENKNKRKRKWIEIVSLWRPRWNPKRTEQRTNYYMS